MEMGDGTVAMIGELERGAVCFQESWLILEAKVVMIFFLSGLEVLLSTKGD